MRSFSTVSSKDTYDFPHNNMLCEDQIGLAHEVGLRLQPAGSYYPTAMDIFPVTNNTHVLDYARDTIVQHFQENAQTGLAHHAGLEARGSTFSPNRFQGHRSRLIILDRHRHFYPCLWPDSGELCNYMIQADDRQLLSHLKEHHGVHGGPKDLCCCLWQGCSRHVQHGSLARHLTTHLGIKLRCLNCSAQVARPDCARTHQKKECVCSEAIFQIVPGPSAHIFT